VAYSIILSGLYLPLIFMLVGLMFRGVAFEFRFKAKEHERHLWDKAFIGGSVVGRLLPGRLARRLPDGITVSGRSYAGGRSTGWRRSRCWPASA
jgi:cytochrome d ubiquinol oxidase subunit II